MQTKTKIAKRCGQLCYFDVIKIAKTKIAINEELQCSVFQKHHLLNVLMAKNNLFDLITYYFSCSLLYNFSEASQL